MTVRVKILILLVIPLPPLCIVINATHSQECGEKNLIGHHGILTSPNYPNQYPEKTNCSWFLKTSNNTTVTIIITNLDIEEDEAQCQLHNDCCKNNALTISNEKLCGKARFPPRIVSTGETTIEISFRTSKNPQRRKGFRVIFSIRSKTLCDGYDLSCLDERSCYNRSDICDSRYKCADHSDEINCAKCGNNQATCNNHSNFCFDASTERCDDIFQCPQGEDELDCYETCPNRIRCGNGWGCYSQNQICDHKSDCSDNSDEMDCTQKLCGKPPEGREYFLCKNRKCIDAELIGNNVDDCGDNSDVNEKKETNFVALVILSTVSLSIGFVMLVHRWYTTRRSIHRFMQDLPVFPLPPFRGPGETDHIVCNLFSQSDFLHGGQIYEAFVRSRRRLPPERTRRSVSTPTQGEQRFFRNYNPSCAAAALASLGIASDSSLSSNRNEFYEKCEKCDFGQFARDCRGLSNSTATSDERKCSKSGENSNKTKEVLQLYFYQKENEVRLVESEEVVFMNKKE